MQKFKYSLWGLLCAAALYLIIPFLSIDLSTLLEKMDTLDVNKILIASFFLLSGIWFDLSRKRELYHKINREELHRSNLKQLCHIMNNVLNTMQVIRIEASDKKPIDERTLRILDASITDISRTIKEISETQDVNMEELRKIAYSNIYKAEEVIETHHEVEPIFSQKP